MRPRHIILAGLVMAAALLGWLALGPAPTGGDRLLPEHASLPQSMGIQVPDQPAVRIEQREDAWWLTEPAEVPGRHERIVGIARITRAASRARYAADEVDAAAAGLDEPRLTLDVDGQTLAFGGTEPLSRQRYVQIGDTVHLTDDDVLPFATQPWTELVARQVLGPAQRITAIELPGLDGRAPVTMRRTGDEWRTDQGRVIAAEAIAEWLEAWQTLPAEEVVEGDAEPATGMIIITLEDQEVPLRLELVSGEGAGDFRLRRADAGLIYRFSAAAGQRLAKPPVAR